MERNYTIDFVKFFAILAVVCIHTGTVSGVQLGAIDGDQADFIIDILARFAVPFFFVASGYLFIQKINTIDSTKQQFTYFKKYILKLTKLWTAWFAFYFLYDLAINYIETEKSVQAMHVMFQEYLATYFTWETLYYGAGHTQYHLWFLLALIWSIAILFIFTKFRLLRVLFIISLGLNIYGLFGQSYSSFFEVALNTRDALFMGLFYTTLGGLVGKYAGQVKEFAMKIPVFVYIGVITVFSLVQVLEGYYTIKILEGNEQNYFLATIPLIIILFMAIIKHNKIGKNSLISKIGANSVGIYVSHVFVMEAIRLLVKRLEITFVQDTILWNILFTPTVFIVAYFLYIGIQQLKTGNSMKRVYRWKAIRESSQISPFNPKIPYHRK
ncbi:acyltransferase [Virgibacillus litoralis]|uniref:Surface polysaccharide O-acyltransferase-like enzyme n=1 Tax=Virgibacillus litoralis TaxID=578221 RepID=A0ABS4HD46_9BACI|nr:acyltransferase [Virgibacillus litoralis]MBP1948793.1 surface polysaccharide O-acyltransferase-like enzyme [Virgibacillus litoralis]